ncbi:hypothetical protein Sste5346_003794 [Sporothrix stenoceras]|uniref:NWD NACHT-NTPase N-terminal domain-containing protein n=1 Tax=Sporothrix stenoceras TaxID=5173 RepID=A0ABR3ZCR1_9PEZI
MAQLNISSQPAPGVTIDQNDDKITITITTTTTPPSDDGPVGPDTPSLWHEAYVRLREEHTEELVSFEEQVRLAFRPLQRRNSPNALGHSAVPGLHNMAPGTVLGAVQRWISEGESKGDERDEGTERDDGTERDEGTEREKNEARRALLSTKRLFNRNMQESPSAHLAWVAASLCVQTQTLAEKTWPTSDAPGFAYIVARISFYDRLSQLVSSGPGDDEEGDRSLREVLVNLYTAVLKQLVVVLALGRVPRETRANQKKQRTFDGPDMSVGGVSGAMHPIIVLELSLGQDARDKALEESISKLVRLQAPPIALSDMDDGDARETANDTETNDDDDSDDDDSEDDDSDDDADDDNCSDPDQRDNNKDDYSVQSEIQSEIQKLLCVTPVRPPSLQPPPSLALDGSPGVLKDLSRWVSQKDAYQRWCKARSTVDVGVDVDANSDSNDRILWLHGPDGSSTTMLLHALAQAETKKRIADINMDADADIDAGQPRHAVACAFWDWSRDVNGTSVVSVVRDLVWTVLAAQPTLQKHLAEAVRTPLLGGNDNDSTTKALYAALGTSCDFYAMLALLCRIVRDPAFAPTCFVVDYMDELLGDDDDVDDEGDRDESYKIKNGRDGRSGRSDPARNGQKRAWTLRDLVALVHTTCRISGKVAWIVSSSSSSSLSTGGCHLHLSPEDPTFDKIMHSYIRALLQCRPAPTYTLDMLDQLASELTRRSGNNITWSTLAVNLLARVRLPWNAMNVLQRLPDNSAGLGPLLDWIVRDNARDSASDNASGASDQALVNTVLNVTALAFRPLTVPELAALAELPPNVDAAILITVLARPLLELRDVNVDVGSGKVQTYVYFSSQAVLTAHRARLAKATAAPDLHAGMVCRHLRCLARHYGDVRDTGRGQLSLYMKIAWLRHLDRVGIGRIRTGDQLLTGPLTDPLTNGVCDFAARNAGAWLYDLDALGTIAVVRRMLQDLLPSAIEQGQLSPMQAALKTLFTRILRPQVMDMPLADIDRFLCIAGCNIDVDYDDDDLPVLPQVPQISLPGLPSLDSPKMADAAAPIATLEGHTDWVRDTHWPYSSRVIVSISDDDTLRFWDRASCRVQHFTEHTLPGYARQLELSQTDPSMLVAMDRRVLVHFDLDTGAVPVMRKTHAEIVAEWREKQDENAADEELSSFSNIRFDEGSSNDVIVACVEDDLQPREIVLGMPGFNLKEVRRIELGYESLLTGLVDVLAKGPVNALLESECNDAVLADDVQLAAVVSKDGDVLIYNTKLAELQQTLHWSQSKFVNVSYDSLWRMFFTRDERGRLMFHFVQKRGEEVEPREQEPTKPAYMPLIRSYRPPHSNPRTYAFSRDRDEVIFTDTDSSITIYKVIEADADAGNNGNDTRDHITPDTRSIRVTTDTTAPAPDPFTSTLLSHDGLRVATANDKGQVKLWNFPNMATSKSESETSISDASAATIWHTMECTESEINWLTFSSDDTLLLACYDNGKADVWDTNTGERVAVMGGHEMWVRFATFLPGNTVVVTASYDGLIRLWDLESCREVYQDTHGNMDGYFVDEDSKSDDSESDGGKSGDDGDGDGDGDKIDSDQDNRNDSNNEKTPISKRIFVALDRAATGTTGTVAFSPDGRFLATSGQLGHIWDISPDPASNTVLPTGPFVPCATLYWEDTSTQKRRKGRKHKRDSGAEDNDNGNDDDDDDGSDFYDDDDDDEASDATANLHCYSFVFSPDSRSLLGFCSDGRLFVWTRTSSTPSSSSINDDRWQPRAAVLADGFAVPGQDSLWAYQPRRLSVSEDTEGQYLLHTEIGVWVLPSPSSSSSSITDGKVKKVGLQPSPHHPCNVVVTGDHMAILWQNRLLTKLPVLYTPCMPYYFSSYTCDVRSVDGDTSTLVIASRWGREFARQARQEAEENAAAEADFLRRQLGEDDYDDYDADEDRYSMT